MKTTRLVQALMNKSAAAFQGKKWALISFLLAQTAITAHAQQPFQDGGKGDSTLFSPRGGFVQINVAGPSAKIGYLHEINPSPWSIGFEAGGKLTGSRASILSSSRIVPDAHFSVSIGRKYLFAHRLDLKNAEDKKRLEKAVEDAAKAGLKTTDTDIGDYWTDLPYDRLSFQIGYAHKQYKLFDSTANFDKQVRKKDFNSPFASLNYFAQLKRGNLFGISLGVERTNNSDELTEVEVRDINATTNNGVTREVTRIQKALRGNYEESTGTFLNTDYAWFPSPLKRRIGFNVFTRNSLSGSDKEFRPGFGIFLSEKGAPTRVIGGVSVMLTNGKASVAIIAGYNF